MFAPLASLLTKLNVSPKVAVPFLAGLIGWAVTWISTGHFDGAALAVLAATLGYGLLGVAAPPAVGVKQKQVTRLVHRR
jgi:hypothetical protein